MNTYEYILNRTQFDQWSEMLYKLGGLVVKTPAETELEVCAMHILFYEQEKNIVDEKIGIKGVLKWQKNAD